MNITRSMFKYFTGEVDFNIPLPASAADPIMRSFKSQPGLYLHIPFCESICPFCPYNKIIYSENIATTYLDALEQEIDWYLEYLEKPFTSLYIGGGTPTLCLEQLEPIMKKLPVAGERAIEVLPGHATESSIARMQELGINYLSLGIQSFSDSVLDYLKRPNSVAENHRALDIALGQFDCVDVDLIFDVAFEDEAIFLRDLAICFQAGVEQVSSYPLMRFGYTPFGKADHLPEKEHQVLSKAAALAEQYGYERRSVWTFNRKSAPGYTSITREFYLGCGAGAGSYTGERFFINHFSISAYIQKVEHGNMPIARETRLSSIKSAAYYVFWQAYTGRIDIQRFDALFTGQWLLKLLLIVLRWTGFLKSCGEQLILTQKGYDRYHDLERWVTYRFIEPLWADMMHEHSDLQDQLPPLSDFQRFWLRLSGMNKS